MSNLTVIPDNAKGSVWYCPDTDQIFIRYVVHCWESTCSFMGESDPEFCPHMEYNFVYVGEL